jgi:hypothetical protein
MLEGIIAGVLVVGALIGGCLMGRTKWFDRLMRDIGELLNGS